MLLLVQHGDDECRQNLCLCVLYIHSHSTHRTLKDIVCMMPVQSPNARHVMLFVRSEGRCGVCIRARSSSCGMCRQEAVLHSDSC